MTRLIALLIAALWVSLAAGRAQDVYPNGRQAQAPFQPRMEQGSVPVPDPTILTTRQVEQAVEVLTDKMLSADKALRDHIDSKIMAIDRATELRIKEIERIPLQIKESIGHLNDLIMARFEQQNEKFLSINRQFIDQAASVEKAASVSQTAISTAFSNAEKAVDKERMNTGERLAILSEQQRVQKDSLDKVISDLKDRLTLIEGRQSGSNEARAGISESTALMIGIGGFAIAVISFFANRAKEPQVRIVQVPSGAPTGVTTTTNTTPA